MEPFKNLVSPDLVGHIANAASPYSGKRAASRFRKNVLQTLEELEMKQRVQLIADELAMILPGEDAVRADALLGMLHPVTDTGIDGESNADGIAGWGIWPLSLVVAEHALHDVDRSLCVLREMTMRFSAEFAIRPFIDTHSDKTFSTLHTWLDDPSEHVRRLVSEGSRPRLPWGMRLHALVADPSRTIPLLLALRDDESDYVRRSVANHLNDISKDHPDLVVGLAQEWATDAPAERLALLKHGCRTLFKNGHPAVMQLFGFSKDALTVAPLKLSTRKVSMGDELVLSTTLKSGSTRSQKLCVDYVLHAQRANGNTSSKVFKGGTVKLRPGEKQHFARTHKFREVTTRRHYAGEHAISLRINGEDTKKVSFELKLDE